MSALFQERYEAGSSPIHHLDARVKVVTAVLLIFGIMLTPVGAFPAYPLLWAVIGSLAGISKVSAWRLARLGGIAFIFTLAAIPLLFTTPGNSFTALMGLQITDTGAARFLDIVLKSWLSVQIGLLLSITTPFTDLMWALGWLHVPNILVAIISFMYRYLFTLKEEAERMLRARAARSGSIAGHKSGGRLLWQAQIAGGMVGSLFLRSYERSERVYAAMLSRGYTGQIKSQDGTPLSWRSICLGAIPVLTIIAIQVMAWQAWSE